MLCKNWTQDFTWDLVEACRAQQLLGRFAASGMQVTWMEVAADVQVTAQQLHAHSQVVICSSLRSCLLTSCLTVFPPVMIQKVTLDTYLLF